MDGPRPAADATRTAGEGAPTRVVVAEDDVLLREGIATLLASAGMVIVGRAGDAETLLDLVDTEGPSLVVTDIRMPPSQGVEGLLAARTIRARHPDIALLVLSAHVELDHATDLLATGQAIGYLLKSRVTRVDAFIEAVRRVVAGEAVIDPEVVREVFAARRRDDPLDALTPRELEVLRLMAEGRSNAGIAHSLWITDGTVEKHVQSILGKLDLADGEDDHRRVLAVLRYLQAREGQRPR
jgi:serine/threonine-protein kinase PknK